MSLLSPPIPPLPVIEVATVAAFVPAPPPPAPALYPAPTDIPPEFPKEFAPTTLDAFADEAATPVSYAEPPPEPPAPPLPEFSPPLPPIPPPSAVTLPKDESDPFVAEKCVKLQALFVEPEYVQRRDPPEPFAPPPPMDTSIVSPGFTDKGVARADRSLLSEALYELQEVTTPPPPPPPDAPPPPPPTTK